MNTTNEMPLYRCHKEVRALKVGEVLIEKGGPGVTIRFADRDRMSVGLSPEEAVRFLGSMVDIDEDPGYFVVYADGYRSWSPTKAFEEGYTLVETEEA